MRYRLDDGESFREPIVGGLVYDPGHSPMPHLRSILPIGQNPSVGINESTLVLEVRAIIKTRSPTYGMWSALLGANTGSTYQCVDLPRPLPVGNCYIPFSRQLPDIAYTVAAAP